MPDHEKASGFLMAGDAAHLGAFIAQEAVGVAELDMAGRFTLANRKISEMTGYSENELLQRRLQDLAHPDNPGSIGQLERLIQSSEPGSLRKRLVRRDGEPIWVYLSVTRVNRGPAGKPTALAVLLDVSMQQRAEEEARKAAARYHTLFHSIDAGFCVIEMVFDLEGRPVDFIFRETNARFEAVAGLSNVVGARMRELAPAHEQQWFDVYGRVAATGEPARFEQEAKALKRWFGVYAFRLGEARNREVAVLFDDITARKVAERRKTFLSELADRLSAPREENAILQAAVDAVGRFLEVDRCYFVECHEAENRVRIGNDYARPGSQRMPRDLGLFDFGGPDWWRELSRGDLAVEDVTTHSLTQGCARAYRQVGVRAYCAQPLRTKGDWTVVLVATESAPRKWTHDELKLLDHVVARVWPMVERARHEQALRRAQQGLEDRVRERTAELQETIAELETYSYSISHDLRAPLRAIQSYASILREEKSEHLDPEAKKYLRRIVAATERMDRLIRDVLVYSRVSRAELPLERIELGPFIASVIETDLGLSDAKVEIEVASPLGAVRANPALLTQCLSNLLGNAVKFTPAERRPRIRIWSETYQNRVHVFVRDNGIGIPPEERERIFGLFYRLGQTAQGTGIGLAVVRKAADRMGGKIVVMESNSSGSTFLLELPAASGG